MKKIMGLTAVLLTMCVMLCSCNEVGTKKTFFYDFGFENKVGVCQKGKLTIANLDTAEIHRYDVPKEIDYVFFVYENIEEGTFFCDFMKQNEFFRYNSANDSIERDEEASDLIFPKFESIVGPCEDGFLFIRENKLLLFWMDDNGQVIEKFIRELPEEYDAVIPASGRFNGMYEESYFAITNQETIKIYTEGRSQKTIRLPDDYDTIVYIWYDEIIYIQNDRIKVYDVRKEKITKDIFAGDDFKVEPKKKTAKKVTKTGKTSAPATKDNSDKSIDDVIDHFGTYFDVYRDLPWASVDSDYFLYAGAMDGCCAEIDDNEVYILKFDTSDAGANSILRNIRETNIISLPLGVQSPAIVNGSFVIAHYQAHPKKNKVIEVFSEF